MEIRRWFVNRHDLTFICMKCHKKTRVLYVGKVEGKFGKMYCHRCMREILS